MVSDEEYFKKLMAELGTRPLDEEAQETPVKRATPEWEHDERAEFLAAIETLEQVPHKDELPQPTSGGLRKLKSAKKQSQWEECLDLHGKTAEEAINLLASFVAGSYARNLKAVVVITGKGKHSRGGVPVVKPRVENWILQKGKRYIASYAEAPRAYGGRGAFLLYLKK